MNLSLHHGIKSWVDAVLSFFYPEVCQCCHMERATPQEGFVCQECRKQVQLIQPPFCERCGLPFEGEVTTLFVCSYCQETTCHYSTARAAVGSKDPVLEIIHRYKYQRQLWFEPFLSGLLVQAAAPVLWGKEWDYIVPVPLHPKKQSEREFNQAERLARPLAKATEIPLHTRLLRRVEHTRTQTQLSREERAVNVRKAFALHKGADCQGQRLVVVDDVLTTGATTNACARVLKEAGAAEVCIWTVARGLLN